MSRQISDIECAIVHLSVKVLSHNGKQNKLSIVMLPQYHCIYIYVCEDDVCYVCRYNECTFTQPLNDMKKNMIM